MGSMREAKQVRQLSKLLEEQQEPFALDTYLLERGCSRRTSSASGRAKQKRKRMARFSKLLRALCDTAVVVHGGNSSSKNPTRKNKEECSNGVCRRTQVAAELDRFSSAARTRLLRIRGGIETVRNSCSGESNPVEMRSAVQIAQDPSERGSSRKSDESIDMESKDVDAERNIQPRNNKNEKQLCNAPVKRREFSAEHLKNKPGQQHAPQSKITANVGEYSCPRQQEMNDLTVGLGLPKRTAEDSLFSASAFDILFHCKQDMPCPKPSSDQNQRGALKQTKQLLFDCVKEVIERYGKKDNAGKNKNSVKGAEEIGNIICEKIARWGRTRGNEMNIEELLYIDYLETALEWEDTYQLRMQISLEIGDSLVEDIISKEIVAELICH